MSEPWESPSKGARHGSVPDLSIVIPCHDEEGNVEPLYREIAAALCEPRWSFELLFVDDGSADATAARVRALAAADRQVRLVELAANFGEAAALSAGFHAARANIVVSIDGDGQNDPAAIPLLLRALQVPGVRAVSGYRRDRVESGARRLLPSRAANRLIAALSGLPVHDCGCGLKAYERSLVANIHLPPGAHRFLPAILGVHSHAFREVEIRDRPRASGSSHYGLKRIPVVLRDLLALPFLVRERKENEIRCALATGLSATLGAVAPPYSIVLALFFDAAAVLLGISWWGVRRFNRAQQVGVYRLREDE